MKLIPLTQGKFAMVDDEDFEELSQVRWYAARDGKTFYAFRKVRIDARTGAQRQRTVSMHKALTGLPVTDHRDGNGLNNQRANLRDGRMFNNRNRPLRRDSLTGLKGVHRDKQSGRWIAKIEPAGGRRYLGRFTSKEDAARAYDAAARELYGEYGCYNFPLPGERSALTGELVAA